MSDESVVTQSAPTQKPAAKPANKVGSKPAGKPAKPMVSAKAEAPKKKATVNDAPKEPGEFGIERTKDLPWGPKKLELFKTLKALKATGVTSAKSAAEIVEKSGSLTARDVRHYSYHAKAAGLIEVAKTEGVAGYSFYLTVKGASIDLTKVQKELAASS